MLVSALYQLLVYNAVFGECENSICLSAGESLEIIMRSLLVSPVGWLRELVYHPWGRYTSRLETRHIPRVRARQRNSSGVVYDPPIFSGFFV